MYELSGKVAFITGAAGVAGIGRAIALRLAERGAHIAVNDLRPTQAGRPGLPDVVDEIEALGARGLAVYGDVADSAQVDVMFAQSMAHFGRLDILVNNAGAPAGDDRVPIVELSEAAFDLVQRVNVRGTFLCSRAAARLMIGQAAGGRIINISSTAGKQGVARYAAYCASKFAIRGFTQSLALELAAHQITVNAICPGLIASERIDDMAAALRPADLSTAEFRQRMIDQATQTIPLGRLAETGDIANLAAFLSSEQASFITGKSISVDGGLHLD
ncbi:MAG: 3-oxoacyl-ACP reductase FabG [Chloroflexi bacterium]|nr:3-oxoacyl-ACP reductase FabG [Chloroflexota bacterium]MCY3582544.1 3-oxoacyl-ACP reductase FabG [Chloroflexota bacterium]MCY3715296.1 3-oxoacyl-ACP reductase FabG [Chloroflexota bacterium]MDE2650193.1 3-oxoacyl-ACP reductase FabG [Chloroflexota bacterium]MXV92116.1 3-oxoacyl-ACP reductase FabG [Chloroflexota bacterium]